MASGILGVSAPTAATNTTVYTVPASTTASFSVNICNKSFETVYVRLALAATGTPASSEWLMYDIPVEANSAIERTGLVAGATINTVVYTNSSDVAVQVYGYEA